MAEKLKELNDNLADISDWLGFDRAPWIIAGPCSAETEEQMLATARGAARCSNVKVFRAGIWKPRTRPNMFEGVGQVGLQWLKAVKAETSLMTTTEVATARHVDICLKNDVDIVWVGARTTVNPFLVQEIAEALKGVDIPVLVKNPVNAELGLWLGAIERLYQAGISKLVAIHRGFSTYTETEYRNSPNWQIPIELKRQLPNLPLICDPSHIAGDSRLIERVSQMALDLGIKGLMIEVHVEPAKALSDAKQQITPDELTALIERLHAREARIADESVRDEIAEMRTYISQTDWKIIHDLSERMKWVQRIGKLKEEHGIPVLQIDRWEMLLEDHMARAVELGLDGEFIKSVFELIHTQAVKKQL